MVLFPPMTFDLLVTLWLLFDLIIGNFSAIPSQAVTLPLWAMGSGFILFVFLGIIP